MSDLNRLFNKSVSYRSMVVSALFYTPYEYTVHSKSCKYLLLIELDYFRGWLPDGHKAHLTKLANKWLYNNNMKRMHKLMNKQTIWVLNNLNELQMAELDANYPDAERLDSMLEEACQNDITFAIKYDYKGMCHIAFANQGEYACSGRSDSVLDALIIVTYKVVVANFDLSSQVLESKPKFKRG